MAGVFDAHRRRLKTGSVLAHPSLHPPPTHLGMAAAFAGPAV